MWSVTNNVACMKKQKQFSGVGFTSRYWNHQHWRKCTWKVRIIQESWWSIWEAGKKSLPIWVDAVLAPLVKKKCAQKKNREKPAHLLLHLWHTGGLGLNSNNSSSRWRKGRQRTKTGILKRILSLNHHPPLQHTQQCCAPLLWVFSCFGSLLLWLRAMSPCCNRPLSLHKIRPSWFSLLLLSTKLHHRCIVVVFLKPISNGKRIWILCTHG